MNHEVEREVGELAKLRRFYERVRALRDEWRDRLPTMKPWLHLTTISAKSEQLEDCAADIDALLEDE